MSKVSFFILSLFIILTSMPLSALEKDEHLYATLLTRENSSHIKVAAQSIFNKNISNLQLTDMAAEVLGTSLDGKITLDSDTNAWLAKAIGSSKSKRYASFLNAAIESSDDGKFKKHAKNALSDLINDSEETFVKGSVNFEKIENQLLEDKKAGSKEVTSDLFNKVFIGDPINTVLSSLGYPDELKIVYGSRKQRWVGVVTYSMLDLEYEEHGNIHFYFDKNEWTVRKMLAKRVEGDLSSNPMMNQDPRMLTAHIQSLIRSASATDNDRDIAAERLFTEMNDPALADSLAWATKLLATSGTPRYRTVLEDVVKNSKVSKLEKYAKIALKKLAKGDTDQYLKGDIYKNE